MIPVVILAGGEGRRLGGRKPERLLGGTPLIAHVIERARDWGGPIAVSCRQEPWSAADARIERIFDAPGSAGPLAGLAAALTWAEGLGFDKVMVTPCDTPFLPADLPRRLADALAVGGATGGATGGAAGAAVASSGGRWHPACSLWRTESLSDVLCEAGGEKRSLRGAAARAGAIAVDWPPEEADAFANINTPEDLAWAQARWAEISAA